MTLKCKEKCKVFKGLINFIRDVPKFVLADKCNHCNMWYPKDKMKRVCFCCGGKIRTSPEPSKNKKYNYDNKKIAEIIENKIKNGWTLIKSEDITKSILDYKYDVYHYQKEK